MPSQFYQHLVQQRMKFVAVPPWISMVYLDKIDGIDPKPSWTGNWSLGKNLVFCQIFIGLKCYGFRLGLCKVINWALITWQKAVKERLPKSRHIVKLYYGKGIWSKKKDYKGRIGEIPNLCSLYYRGCFSFLGHASEGFPHTPIIEPCLGWSWIMGPGTLHCSRGHCHISLCPGKHSDYNRGRAFWRKPGICLWMAWSIDRSLRCLLCGKNIGERFYRLHDRRPTKKIWWRDWKKRIYNGPLLAVAQFPLYPG